MQPNNFLHDGRQVSDRPENLVGPPALGYLVSWRRSWVVAQKCGGLRDGTIKHDKSSWRWHTKNCIVNLSYLLCCDGFRWVFNVSSSLLMYFGGGFWGNFYSYLYSLFIAWIFSLFYLVCFQLLSVFFPLCLQVCRFILQCSYCMRITCWVGGCGKLIGLAPFFVSCRGAMFVPRLCFALRILDFTVLFHFFKVFERGKQTSHTLPVRIGFGCFKSPVHRYTALTRSLICSGSSRVYPWNIYLAILYHYTLLLNRPTTPCLLFADIHVLFVSVGRLGRIRDAHTHASIPILDTTVQFA